MKFIYAIFTKRTLDIASHLPYANNAEKSAQCGASVEFCCASRAYIFKSNRVHLAKHCFNIYGV